jgi:NYN domain
MIAKSSQLRRNVYFFYDFSNIGISAQQLASNNGDGQFAAPRLRIHTANLRHLVERDRNWMMGYAAVGLKDLNSPIKRQFQSHGIELEISERGLCSGKEQNVDERISDKILRLLKKDEYNGTIVLASGDAGFIEPLDIMRRRGYKIEVMSWQHSLSRSLHQWATEHGRVVLLDDFYHELTFVQGERFAHPVSVLNRKLARMQSFIGGEQ